MSTTLIIISIAVVIFISVVVTGIIQQREQARAAKRQAIAKYRYRANEAQEMLDRHFEVPIGKSARIVLLQYIAANLKAILDIEANDVNAERMLDHIRERIQSPEVPADASPINMPTDPQVIMQVLGRLKNMLKFFLKLRDSGAIDKTHLSEAMRTIKKLYIEVQIKAYISVGKKALGEQKVALAHQNFSYAHEMLIKQDISNPKIQAMLSELQELMKTKVIEPEVKTELEEQIEQEEEGISLGDSDDLFQPKKKW